MKVYELHYQKNIRDIGGMIGFSGKKVKSGRIFRGGFLDKIAPEDVPILESFKLTDVVDFRGETEFINRPDYVLLGVKYHNFPVLQQNVKNEHLKHQDGNLLWFIGDHSSGFEHMTKIYHDMIVTKDGQEAFKNYFKILMQDDDRVIYFHCSQGKDRAGMAAFLTEIALGVSLEDAKEDYLASNKAMLIRVDTLLRQVEYKDFYNEEYKQSLFDVFSAKLAYLQVSIDAMENMSGTILDYIKNVLEVDIDRLREMYLE